MTHHPKDAAQSDRFIEIARELGCDPDDPRVSEALKSMGRQAPKPHEPPSPEKRKPKPKA